MERTSSRAGLFPLWTSAFHGARKYLNNIVEQDHRRVKFRVSAMLGFKTFENARIVLAGIELIQKLKKGQYGVPRKFGMCSLHIWRSVLAA